MFYIIYKITNKVNGKVYIGKHQTENVDDGYMGSGKLIKRAIDKHGIENFEKEILFKFSTEEEMNAKERELVTEDFCSRNDTYNLCPGGQGGFGFINLNGKSINTFTDSKIQIMASKKGTEALSKLNNDGEWKKTHSLATSNGLKEKWKNDGHPWKGRKHTPETIAKMKKPKNVMENNPNFGKMWITNGVDNKMIKRYADIPDGWRKGRKL